MSAKERMQDLQAALNERGAEDVKFYFSQGCDTPASHVAEDVEHVLRSYIDGRVHPKEPLRDSQR